MNDLYICTKNIAEQEYYQNLYEFSNDIHYILNCGICYYIKSCICIDDEHYQ